MEKASVFINFAVSIASSVTPVHPMDALNETDHIHSVRHMFNEMSEIHPLCKAYVQ
jgi:hypothetical protein